MGGRDGRCPTENFSMSSIKNVIKFGPLWALWAG
jgi:hypothetical protein